MDMKTDGPDINDKARPDVVSSNHGQGDSEHHGSISESAEPKPGGDKVHLKEKSFKEEGDNREAYK